jgi:hypothetical protein
MQLATLVDRILLSHCQLLPVLMFWPARALAALGAAKARGKRLGGHRQRSADITSYRQRDVEAARAKAAAKLADVAEDLRRLSGEGLTLSGIAQRLNDEHIRPIRGCNWTATAVRRALNRPVTPAGPRQTAASMAEGSPAGGIWGEWRTRRTDTASHVHAPKHSDS